MLSAELGEALSALPGQQLRTVPARDQKHLPTTVTCLCIDLYVRYSRMHSVLKCAIVVTCKYTRGGP